MIHHPRRLYFAPTLRRDDGQVHRLGHADRRGDIARDVGLDEDVARRRLDQEDRRNVGPERPATLDNQDEAQREAPES